MMLYAALILLGAIAALVFRRLFVAVVRILSMVIVVLFGSRLALLADERLAQPGWVAGGIVGGVAAFVVVGLLSYALIYHSLIRADERRDIERAHETAKRRRLW